MVSATVMKRTVLRPAVADSLLRMALRGDVARVCDLPEQPVAAFDHGCRERCAFMEDRAAFADQCTGNHVAAVAHGFPEEVDFTGWGGEGAVRRAVRELRRDWISDWSAW